MELNKAEIHLKVLELRINALEKELQAALENGRIIDEKTNMLRTGVDIIHTNRNNRSKEMETKFDAELAEQNREIQLAEDVLAKKKEERQALLSYLKDLKLLDVPWSDYRNFDWETLRRAAENIHKPKEELMIQHEKAEALEEYLQRASNVMGALNEKLTSLGFVKERLAQTLDELRLQSQEWIRVRGEQEKRIHKLQGDNERLNLLVRQCLSSSEPISEYVTKNVQAKCHSFLNSDSPTELYNGLMKFKMRQERIIKLLQYKDNQIGSETNKLEVARDQTQDQLKFYQNLIKS